MIDIVQKFKDGVEDEKESGDGISATKPVFKAKSVDKSDESGEEADNDIPEEIIEEQPGNILIRFIANAQKEGKSFSIWNQLTFKLIDLFKLHSYGFVIKRQWIRILVRGRGGV